MISFWSLIKQQRNRLGTRHFLQLLLLRQLQTGPCGPSCSLIQRVFSESSSPRHPILGSSPPAALLCGPLFTFPPRSCSCTWGVSLGTGSETRAAAFPPVLSSKPAERTSLPEIHITAGALEGQGPAAAVAKATRGAEKSRGSGLASRGQGVEGRAKGWAQLFKSNYHKCQPRVPLPAKDAQRPPQRAPCCIPPTGVPECLPPQGSTWPCGALPFVHILPPTHLSSVPSSPSLFLCWDSFSSPFPGMRTRASKD